jgi:ribosomal protein S18 acetylase RimI-like enzyme
MASVDLRPFRPDDALVLADIHARNAALDHADPYSTMESLPTAAELVSANQAAIIFRVAETGEGPVGYGSLQAWTEQDGTRVYLTDGYVTPQFRGNGIATRLLQIAEDAAREKSTADATAERSVLAGNGSSAHPDRIALLEDHQYQRVFAMIEMELRDLKIGVHRLPARLGIRNATVDDTDALIELTERAWAGRPFYSRPTTERYRAWLAHSDLSLFHVATTDDQIVGFVATIQTPHRSEIDDVLVDPDFRRRGIARSMLATNISLLRERRVDRVRLHTEAHDPDGARSLYETLGFRVIREYGRYRKPLTNPPE